MLVKVFSLWFDLWKSGEPYPFILTGMDVSKTPTPFSPERDHFLTVEELKDRRVDIEYVVENREFIYLLFYKKDTNMHYQLSPSEAVIVFDTIDVKKFDHVLETIVNQLT